MTSPWSAVLTSSADDHLDADSAAFARASSAPEISLWSVTAIAPRPCVAGGRQQHLDRRGAVVRVVGVHVQVDVDQRARRPAARRTSGSPVGRRGGARRPRRRPPRSSSATRAQSQLARAARARRAAAPAQRRRRAIRRSSWAASVSTSPGSNSRPRSPSRRAPPRRRRGATATGTAPAPSARTSSPGAGATPCEAATSDVGGGEHRVLGRSCSRQNVHAVAQRASSDGRRRARGRRTRSPPSPARSAAGAARAGTAAAPRAPPGRRRRSAAGRRRPRARRGRRRRRAAGPVARPGRWRCISSRVASKVAVRASRRPKNELDEAPRDLGGEHALGRRVEACRR